MLRCTTILGRSRNAVVPLGRICAAGGGQLASLPQPFNQRHELCAFLAEDRVVFSIADALPRINKLCALRDVSPSEALALPRRAAAVPTAALATPQLLPQ